VLDGDPTKPGLYTMRLSMPDGYRLPPHFHPADEHVTAISGKFQVGMGDTFDAAKLSTLPAGTFGMIPTGMAPLRASKRCDRASTTRNGAMEADLREPGRSAQDHEQPVRT
jgi:uncharacterized protein DUF4437